MRVDVQKMVAGYAYERDRDKDMQKINKELGKLRSELNDLDAVMLKHSKLIKATEDSLETKAKLGEFRALEIHTKLLPTKEDIEQLQITLASSIHDNK